MAFNADWCVHVSIVLAVCETRVSADAGGAHGRVIAHDISQVGGIIARFEKRGYKLVAMKLIHASKDLLAVHYGDLKTKPFFNGLVEYMSSGPLVAMVCSFAIV